MTHFRKFPSIGQYSNLVKNIRSWAKYNEFPLPVLTFTGVPKIHGTNSAACYDPATGEVWAQSRERIVTFESDNAGFAAFVEANQKKFAKILGGVKTYPGELLYLYGEWFGPGIHRGVAVNSLTTKHFGLFSLVAVVPGELEAYRHLSLDEVKDVYVEFDNVVTISDIKTYHIEIDFERPDKAQNKLLEMTLAVEEECPVGKFFGKTGIGEGIVFTCDTNPDWTMKCKGEKHSSSKVKTVRELTEAEITSKNNATEFVEYACTENRMLQGVEKLKEMGLEIDLKSMGPYLKWIGGDILSECKETLLASGIDRKDVMPRVADKARNWFITYIDDHAND
jgi:hypothetical protein